MLRFQQAINLGIASILVIPAVALQSGNGQSLEQALEDTIAALDHLVRIDDQLGSGDSQARELLLSATEDPLAAGPKRDEYLDTLRRDVNILTMQLDRETPVPTPGEMVDGEVSIPVGQFPKQGSIAKPTTGLSEEARRQLAGINSPLPGAATADKNPKLALEDEGFVVDPVLLGRSYFRAGRFVEGVELLSKHKTTADGAYWLGRCLEKLERFNEAIEAYSSVLEQTQTGYIADRARNDMEFLKWKQEFQTKINNTQRGQ